MKIPYFFAPLLVTLISCGVPSVRGDLKEEIPPKSSSDFFSNWLVDTEVSATRLVAGDTLDIRCIVTRAGDLLSATQTQVLVTPSLESSSLVEANGTYQFTATQTGPYIFQCQARSRLTLSMDGIGIFLPALAIGNGHLPGSSTVWCLPFWALLAWSRAALLAYMTTELFHLVCNWAWVY